MVNIKTIVIVFIYYKLKQVYTLNIKFYYLIFDERFQYFSYENPYNIIIFRKKHDFDPRKIVI